MRPQRAPSRRSASRWEGEGSGVIPRPTESRRKAQGVAWRPSIITSLQGLRPGASRPLALHDGEELRSCAGVLAEYPARRRRHHLTARLLDPPHGHTEMFRFDHHARTGCVEPTLAEEVGNLRREPLLNLRPPRQDFYKPRHLADAEDASFWNVPDVGNTMEWQEMMLTHRIKGNVFHNHQFVVVLVVEADLQQLPRILLQPGKQLFVHLRDAARRAQESFTLRILADTFDNLLHCLLNGRLIHPLHLGGHPSVPPYALCEFRR